MRFSLVITLIACSTLLTHCGGGGGGSSTTQTTTSSTTATSAPTSSVASSANSSLTPSIALKDSASFPVGVAVNAGSEKNSLLNSTAQQTVVAATFSQITPGNIMKMSYLHPAENTYTYSDADALATFAHDHNMTLHAHALIWHSDYQVPSWIKNYSGDKTAWLAMLKTHEQTIAAHFAGKVKSWDVVNEALADDGNYRDSIFYQHTGSDYIAQAFTNTHEADANAELYYNEYDIESNTKKMSGLTTLLDDFIARKIPINGVGFQMHIFMDYPSITSIKNAFQQIVDRQLKVKISELDIPINNPYSSDYKAGIMQKTLTTELALAQKKRYCDVIKAYMDTVPAQLRGGIVVWGLADSDSWLSAAIFNNNPDWPLLFNDQLQPKPALQGVNDGLTGQMCSAL